MSLSRYNFFFKKPAGAICLVPLFIPPHIHAIAWTSLLGEKGVLQLLFMDIFDLHAPIINLYSPVGVAVILALSYFPLVVITTRSGLLGISKHLEEAASLSKSSFTVWRTITLPLAGPYIATGCIFTFIFSFFNYGVPSMLRVVSFPVEIFSRFSVFYDLTAAATLSSLPILVALLLLFLLSAMHNRPYVTVGKGRLTGVTTTRKSSGSFFLTTATILVLFVTVFFPLGALFIQAGGIESFKVAFRTSRNDIVTTVIIAAIAATLASTLAYFLACFIGRNKTGLEKSLNMLTFLPFAFPATLFGIALISFWNRPMVDFVYTTITILIIAYIGRFIPFAVRIILTGLGQVNPAMYEAGAIFEGSWLKRLFYIDLPLAKRGLLASWILVFVFSMGELGATLLVVPPGTGTVALKIYTLMHYGAGPLVAALALILITINLVVSSGFLLVPKHTA
jgi:iron(III) transport system permease protein